MQKAARLVGVNEHGRLVGEGHPRAVLTDREVDIVLELRAEGYSYGWLAEKFEVHKGTVAKICTCQRRAQIVAAWRGVRDARRQR